jgi:hypothetical protein
MFFKRWKTWFSFTGEKLTGDEYRSRDPLALSLGQRALWRGQGALILGGYVELVFHNFDSRCTTVSCRRTPNETNT